MRTSYLNRMFAGLLALPLLAGNAMAAESLRVAGTGGAMAMVEQVAAGFAVATGIKIEVIPALGSKGGIRAAADGAVDIAVSARPLAPEEAALGLTAIVSNAQGFLSYVTS